MLRIHELEHLRRSPASCLFEGARHGDGVSLSVFVTEWATGGGPGLHRHPYAEVFLVEAGEAIFTVDGEDVRVGAARMVVVPPETPHRFHNPGPARLRLVSLQPSPTVVQVDL